MEEQIRKLKAPAWPEKIFGEVNQKLASEGKTLYINHCAECHVPGNVFPNEPPDYGLKPYKMIVKPVRIIGTDPKTAKNFNGRRVKTGRLKKFFKEEDMVPPSQIIEDLTTGLRIELLDDLIEEITIKDEICNERGRECEEHKLLEQICVPGVNCLNVKQEVQSIRRKLRKSQESNLEKLEKEIKKTRKKIERYQMTELEKEFDGIHAASRNSQEAPPIELVKLWKEKKDKTEQLKKKIEEEKNVIKEIRDASENLKKQIDGRCETNLLLMEEGIRKRVESRINSNMILVPELKQVKFERLKRKKIYALCVFLALVEHDMGRKIEVRDKEVYIARTNAGVWATAPFLHNGSVPNLYQLLSPVKDRAEKFCLGKADFDPKHVGFDVRTPPCIPFSESEFDTTISGNSNKGHEFREMNDNEKKEGYKCHDHDHRPVGVLGCEFEPKERLELIEYLKTSDCEFLTLDCTVPGFVKIPLPKKQNRTDTSASMDGQLAASKIVRSQVAKNGRGFNVRPPD